MSICVQTNLNVKAILLMYQFFFHPAFASCICVYLNENISGSEKINALHRRVQGWFNSAYLAAAFLSRRQRNVLSLTIPFCQAPAATLARYNNTEPSVYIYNASLVYVPFRSVLFPTRAKTMDSLHPGAAGGIRGVIKNSLPPLRAN